MYQFLVYFLHARLLLLSYEIVFSINYGINKKRYWCGTLNRRMGVGVGVPLEKRINFILIWRYFDIWNATQPGMAVAYLRAGT